MAIPTFVAIGSKGDATSAISPGLPAGIAANDILLCFLETAASAAITMDGVWTQMADSPQDEAGESTRLTVFWHRYDGSNSPSTTTSDSGNHQTGVIGAWRGCILSGNPYDVTSGGSNGTAGTTMTATGDTTTVPDCLVIIAATNASPSRTWSAWANADLTNVTERIDSQGAAGNGGSIGVAEGGKATAGAYGNTTATISGSQAWTYITIALKPPAAADSVGMIPIF